MRGPGPGFRALAVPDICLLTRVTCERDADGSERDRSTHRRFVRSNALGAHPSHRIAVLRPDGCASGAGRAAIDNRPAAASRRGCHPAGMAAFSGRIRGAEVELAQQGWGKPYRISRGFSHFATSAVAVAWYSQIPTNGTLTYRRSQAPRRDRSNCAVRQGRSSPPRLPR